MTTTLILLAGLLMAEGPPTTARVCTPPGPKQPSLRMPDSTGKCATGYQPVEDHSGKDVKVMYCVNTVHPKPIECKPVPVPTQNPKPGVH